jgi:hypothetical protein
MLAELQLPVEEFQNENVCSLSPLGINEGVGVVVNELLSPQECKYVLFPL